MSEKFAPSSSSSTQDAAITNISYSVHQEGQSVVTRSLNIETDSNASNSQDADHCYQDVLWSFLSDSFFIAGGICYVVLSVPQWNRASTSLCMTILQFVAPTVYLLNSMVDIGWAKDTKRRHQLKKKATEARMHCQVSLLDTPVPNETQLQERLRNPAILRGRNKPWYIRLRKHAAHRRTLMAAWTFGLAAFLSFMAVVVAHYASTNNFQSLFFKEWAKWLDGMSVHVYILSALISVSGKRSRPWLGIDPCESGLAWLNNPETLEDLGDIFFLLGSLVDGVLCDFTFDDAHPGWAITSALLWLVDACFYLKADFVMAGRIHGRDQGSLLNPNAGLLV